MIFDDVFASFSDKDKVSIVYPFEAMVVVPKDMSPRNEYFEWVLDNSRNFVTAVMTGTGCFSAVEKVILPERWMNPREQQEFMNKLCSHPEVGNLKTLKLVTQCPVIMTDFFATSIKVIEGSAGKEPSRVSGRRGHSQTIGQMFGMGGFQIF